MGHVSYVDLVPLQKLESHGTIYGLRPELLMCTLYIVLA